MTNRFYAKNDLLYTTDGAGKLMDVYVKEVTLGAQVGQGGNIAIALKGASGANQGSVLGFICKIYLANGADYIFAAANVTTFVLANNILTISVAAGGTVIPVGAVVKIIYYIGA